MYLFCLQISGHVPVLFWFDVNFYILVKSNHLNSELGSSSSAANQFWFQPLQIQGVQGKTAYWGKGKWRTDT